MIKNDKIYRIISVCGFVLHVCIFAFVLMVGFLPYYEKCNFYDCFIGFFGDRLSSLQPYLVMMPLLLSCVGGFCAIRRPLFSFVIVLCSTSFFVIATLPYSVEAMVVGFMSPWVHGNMSTYGVGFDLIVAASYVVYFDIAFAVYSVITLFIKQVVASNKNH